MLFCSFFCGGDFIAILPRDAASEKEASVGELQRKLTETQGRAQAAAVMEEEMKGKLAELEGSVREVRGRVEQRRSALSAEESRGAIVKALLAAKADGSITGIYGRLGDLGAIDAKYDVAVSTSCGALDYIVVSTTAVAQRCVELLRRGNYGVATFLILEKQQHLASRMNAQSSPPEGVPRLFDLVRCQDEALKPAFYYALRDTVVATDLQQAGRIAYGQDRRWRRVVTLKVDARQARRELEDDEEKLNSDLEALREAQSSAQQAAAEARSAQQELVRMETAIPKVRIAVQK
eukprot:scaffold222130_cov40-Prasinocladus_malaysianus.AAC.2